MTVAIEAKLRELGSKVESEAIELKPLGRSGRRRILLRRTSLVGLSVATLVALVTGVVLGAGITRTERENVSPSGELETYLDQSYGWEMTYPANWRLQKIDKCPNEEVCEIGVVVSNLEVGFRHYHGVFLTDVPQDFVGIGFAYEHHVQLTNLPFPLGSDTEFPLTLKSLHLAYEWPRSRYWGEVILGGEDAFDVDLWIGPEASDEDIRAVEAILASITKPLHAEPSPLGVGEASTTVGGDEAGVRIEIKPAIVEVGTDPAFLLENIGAVDLEYGVDFKLEMKTGSGGWTFLNEGQAWPLVGFGLPPGGSDDSLRIAMLDASGQVELSPGTYRFTKEFRFPGRDERLTVSALFVVTDETR